MNEERKQILQMLQEGKLSVEEAARLIEAMDDPAVEVVSEPIVAPTQNYIPVANDATSSQSAPESSTFSTLWPLRNAIGCSMDGIQLQGARCDGARIWFSNLNDANFRDANLEGVWIVAANLDHANCEGANLAGARIAGTNLDRADLRGANLEGTTLLGVNMDHADLRGADLRGQTLIGVSFSGQKVRYSAPSVVAEE